LLCGTGRTLYLTSGSWSGRRADPSTEFAAQGGTACSARLKLVTSGDPSVLFMAARACPRAPFAIAKTGEMTTQEGETPRLSLQTSGWSAFGRPWERRGERREREREREERERESAGLRTGPATGPGPVKPLCTNHDSLHSRPTDKKSWLSLNRSKRLHGPALTE